MPSKKAFVAAGIIIVIIIAAFAYEYANLFPTAPLGGENASAAATGSNNITFVFKIYDSPAPHFFPDVLEAVAGSRVVLNIINYGTSEHTFTINATSGKGFLANTGPIRPGANVILDLSVPQQGDYTYYSSISGDAANGLTGQLVVYSATPVTTISNSTRNLTPRK